MTGNKQNNAPIAADFIQDVGKEGMINFEPFIRDKEDAFEQLKVIFLSLPDKAAGSLISDNNAKAIRSGTEYTIDIIKYIANPDTNKALETSFRYSIVDSDGLKSDKKTIVINPKSEQQMDVSDQIIGSSIDEVLIADSYKGYYIWGAGGNDMLIGNVGENRFIIENSGTKINKTTTTIGNFEIFEDKVDLSQLTCVQSINDLNIDSKDYNTQITYKDSKEYPQEILIEKTIPTSVSENNEVIFIFNNNKHDIKEQCSNSYTLNDIIKNKYTLLGGGFVVGVTVMKAITCIYSKFEKSTEVGITNLQDNSFIAPSYSVKTNTARSDIVPIGITLEEGKDIELISLRDSSTYFKYNEVISKTSWVSKSDGILFYDYDKSMAADHKKIVMTEWSKNANTDFEAVLEVFDTNKDKIFDNKDDKFNDFYIWQDKNSNGVVEEGELKSLKEHGIEAINFNESKVSNEEQQKQGILNVATVEWEDGKITNAYDLVFTTEEIVS